MTRVARDGGYLRISEDPNDERTGLDRQRKDVLALSSDPGIVLYPENDTSAFKKRKLKLRDPLGNEYWGWRVIRPLWHQALQDLREGRINRLIVWDLDRLARDPRDLEDAIEVVEHYGATIVSATASEIDLTTESGRMMARVLVLMANKSSADTARRVRRAHQAIAESGKPVGGYRPFGWQEDKATLDDTEAAIMRKVIEDLLAGKSLRSVVLALNDAGVLTTTGRRWESATLRQYLRSPRIVGLRAYRGKLQYGPDGEPIRGLWTPLVDQDTYDRLQALLVRPEGRSRVPKRGARHYLLTGLLRCGTCGGPMYGNKRGGTHFYTCNDRAETTESKHSVSCGGPALDTMIERVILRKLEGAQFERAEAGEWPGQAELNAVEREIRGLMDGLAAGVSGETIWPRVKGLEAKRAEMRKGRVQWLSQTTGPALSELNQTSWNDMDTDTKRAVVEKFIEAIIVRPAKQRGNTLDPERIVLVPRRAMPSPGEVAE